ncbi:LacI family DNA-binding transcriptional regulator [Nocardioides sp.]|jgi:DNA-binding LacI/PurR family transcriptional regulator|uniref:LacI family DNA-binding transcriptional regulator n=1 Tax=Nocardioides sp. TaxID=35761 RepID=UPI002CAB4D2E|nr:LacI family DNA-binding transcriptional regulator [Nocardioides sp.]HVX54847.1 LacI family DNA-binding transcriptional regulator [Nocardioides sp.]
MTRRLAEVAARAGVSEATVSRVLNRKPGVAEATRSRVLTALDVLGYERPTKLRGERARLVGLVLPELQNPIFPAFAEALGANLAQHGLTPVLCTQTAGGVQEPEYVDLLLEQQVAGVIFAGGNYSQGDADHRHYDRLMHRQLPVVLINAAIDRLPFPRVVCDDASAMEQSMEHLLALGHERIGLVLGPRDHVPSERKLAAARQVAEAAGHPLDEELVVRSLYSLQSGQASAARLIERGATGIICASDPLALGAVRAVRRARLATPEDVSVIGYDDSAFMAVADPPLTTVRQPIEAMARAAVDFLMSQIEASMGPVDELLFEPELVVRRSTGPAKLPAADAKS